jgi:acyl carrier protein
VHAVFLRNSQSIDYKCFEGEDDDMAEIVSSHTPEDAPNWCPLCRAAIRIEPSSGTLDAPCPACGALLWFLPTSQGPVIYSAVTASAVFDRARDIFAENLGINVDALDAGTFTREIDADSLNVVELVMAIEEEFHITMRDEDASQIKTIGDAIRYLIERLRDNP